MSGQFVAIKTELDKAFPRHTVEVNPSKESVVVRLVPTDASRDKEVQIAYTEAALLKRPPSQTIYDLLLLVLG